MAPPYAIRSRTRYMPKGNQLLEYREPFTDIGVRLGGEGMVAFHLHEAGCRSIGEHWNFPGVRSPFWRLYWNNRRGAWVGCAGRRYDVEPGHFLLVPSHAVFDTHGAKRSGAHFWIHFSLHPDFTVKGGAPIRVPCGPALARQVATLARCVRHAEPQDRQPLYHLCSALLHQVFARFESEAHPPRLPAKLYALLHEIESSLGRPATVIELARRAGMSRGGFIRWFHQHMGISPARYVMNRRIDHACRLLKFSSATIDDIAAQLGFANLSHFSRAFQKQMGCGPASFRRT